MFEQLTGDIIIYRPKEKIAFDKFTMITLLTFLRDYRGFRPKIPTTLREEYNLQNGRFKPKASILKDKINLEIGKPDTA